MTLFLCLSHGLNLHQKFVHCIFYTTLLLFDWLWVVVLNFFQFLLTSQETHLEYGVRPLASLCIPLSVMFSQAFLFSLIYPAKTLYHSRALGDSPLWDWENFPTSLHAVHKHFLPEPPVYSVLLGEKQRPLILLMHFIYSCITLWRGRHITELRQWKCFSS